MATSDTLNDCQALPETPGFRLQKAREKAQLSIEAVAAELNLSVSKLRALENDQYEKMASDTFVKGYLRSYARVLKLDADEFLRSYEEYRMALRDTAERVTHAAEQVVQKDVAVAKNAKDGLRLPLMVLVGLLAVWALATILYDSGGDGSKSVASKPVASESAASKSVASKLTATSVPAEAASVPVADTGAETSVQQRTEATVTAEVETSVPEVESETPVAETTAKVSTPAEEPSVTTASTASAALPDTLTFEFSGECWVEVSDAKGDVLLTDLQQPGEQLTLQGTAPFKIMLGNAKAVSLRLNGEAVSTETSEGRKTLRLTVGQ